MKNNKDSKVLNSLVSDFFLTALLINHILFLCTPGCKSQGKEDSGYLRTFHTFMSRNGGYTASCQAILADRLMIKHRSVPPMLYRTYFKLTDLILH